MSKLPSPLRIQPSKYGWMSWPELNFVCGIAVGNEGWAVAAEGTKAEHSNTKDTEHRGRRAATHLRFSISCGLRLCALCLCALCVLCPLFTFVSLAATRARKFSVDS